MTLTVVVWKWSPAGTRSQYTAAHVNIFTRSFARFYGHAHRIVCVTDDPAGVGCETFPLRPELADMPNPNGRHLPSCYRRLRLFGNEMLGELGVPQGQPVLSADLDLVFVGDLTSLFHREERFLGWKRLWAPGHRGPRQPPSYNGSLTFHRAGTMTFLWDEFDPLTSPRLASAAGYFGSDQAWVSYRLQGREAGWIKADGVYSYSSDVQRRPFPTNARIISFNGKRKPWDVEAQRLSPWIPRYWR